MNEGRRPQPRNGRSDGTGAHRTFHRTLVDDSLEARTASTNDKNQKNAAKAQTRRPSVPNERARHQKNAAAYEQAAEYAAKSEAHRVLRFGMPSEDAWTTIEVDAAHDADAPENGGAPAQGEATSNGLGSAWETIPASGSGDSTMLGQVGDANVGGERPLAHASDKGPGRKPAVRKPVGRKPAGRGADVRRTGRAEGARGGAQRADDQGRRGARSERQDASFASRRGAVDAGGAHGRSAASGRRASSGLRLPFAGKVSGATEPGHGPSKRPAGRQPGSDRRPSSSDGKSARAASHPKAQTLGRAAVIVAIVMLLAIIAIADGCSHMGRAYAGVTVGDVDVSGMDHDQIVAALQDEYGGYATKTVTVYASQEARDAAQSGSGENDMKKLESAATATQVSSSDATASQTQWSATAASLGASIDYDALADAALAVGRSDGGWQARLSAQHGKSSIPVAMTLSSDQVESLAGQIDQTIGTARVDTSVSISNGVAQVQTGTDGMLVDRDWLANQIQQSLMADGDTSIVAETSYAPSRISVDEAQKTADQINRAISGGAQISSDGGSWAASASDLGSLVRTDEVQADDGTWSLVPSVDAELAKPKVLFECGDADVGNLTVSFTVSDAGDVTVHTTGSGKTLSTRDAADELQRKLFGDGGRAWSGDTSTPVTIQVGAMDVPQEMSLDEAEDLGVVTTIGSYTTTYSNAAGTEPRNRNIHLVSDAINNTVCAAGQQWSFNDRAGDCNEERGFEAAGAIVDGEYVDSIGGGICQVATTVFNAVYESGLQVDNRSNHSLYISSYPAGRDAAVSYPELDLKWSDQFTSDVLLQMSYTDTTVTAKIIGMSTGYTVTSDVGEWQTGQSYTTKFVVDDTLPTGSHYTKTTGTDGRSISVTRTVRDQNGNIVIKDTFNSVYQPKTEVICVGPNTDTSNLGTSS